jgi:hypothetical protein
LGQKPSGNQCACIRSVLPPPAPKKDRTPALADLYDLLSKVFAVQQPKECFWHALDSVEHVFLEADFSRVLPTGETPQRFIPPVPPVEYGIYRTKASDIRREVSLNLESRFIG